MGADRGNGVMFRRKKKDPPPDPSAANVFGIAFPSPQPVSSFASGGVAGSPPQPSLSTIQSSLRGLVSQKIMQQMMGVDETSNPEPKEEPKTVVGLTGYRLYTLDNELYLCGARAIRQEARESEQAQHKATGEYSGLGPTQEHPAPAWGCLCGFAAFFWPTSLEQPDWHGVLAEVQAGGRTICCDEGWRAERIALNRLWVSCPIFPDAALEILRKRYEVPVEVL
jgi:hypothetical protein